MLTTNDLDTAVRKASANRSRLVFVSSDWYEALGMSEKTAVNINKVLSERLIDVPRSERAKSVEGMVRDLIEAATNEIVQVKDLEILFDRSLSIDPVRLLHACAKNKTLLVLWPGGFTSAGLSYAVPGHPEYRTYRASDLTEVILLTSESIN